VFWGEVLALAIGVAREYKLKKLTVDIVLVLVLGVPLLACHFDGHDASCKQLHLHDASCKQLHLNWTKQCKCRSERGGFFVRGHNVHQQAEFLLLFTRELLFPV
jgi:hypothetical protein